MIAGTDVAMMGDKYIGEPYSKIDCQQLWESCIHDAGLSVNLAGSNAWYRKIRAEGWVGTPEECKARFGHIPQGAALFILGHDGKEPAKYQGDGLGNASHIGVYTGRTEDQMMAFARSQCGDDLSALRALNLKCAHGSGAIHGSSSRGCVATSSFSGRTIKGGWNCVGLWNRIDYGITNQNNEPTEVMKMQMIVSSENGGGVNLRAEKRTNSALLATIPEGTTLEASRVDDTWCRATYAGQTGYCMSRFLVPASESAEPDGFVRTLTTEEYSQLSDLRDQLEAGVALLKTIVGVG